MTSVPVHIGELSNMAYAQCLAVAFLKRFSMVGENGRVDVKLLLHFQWNENGADLWKRISVDVY